MIDNNIQIGNYSSQKDIFHVTSSLSIQQNQLS